MNATVRTAALRLGIAVILSAVLTLLVSELGYRLIYGDTGNPSELELVVPPGAAADAEAGIETVQFPDELTFVEGDSIVVVNQDTVSHQLGPVWVPPGTTGRLTLDRPKSYSVDCSFTPDKQMGLVVEPRVSMADRVQATLAMGLPTAILVWLFWLVASPIKGMKD